MMDGLRLLPVKLAEPEIGIGHNNPPEPIDNPYTEIERLKQLLAEKEEQRKQDIREAMCLMAWAEIEQHRRLTGPRKAALRKYRQTHKAELRQRQREYRYYKAVERLDHEEPFLDNQTLARRRRSLREQYKRMACGIVELEIWRADRGYSSMFTKI